MPLLREKSGIKCDDADATRIVDRRQQESDFQLFSPSFLIQAGSKYFSEICDHRHIVVSKIFRSSGFQQVSVGPNVKPDEPITDSITKTYFRG